MIPSPESPKAPVLPEWFSKPHRHPDYCDPCCDDVDAIIKWKIEHIEMLEELVKELAAPKPAPEPPVPVDLEAAFREGFHACDAGMGIEGAWEKSEALRSRLSEAAKPSQDPKPSLTDEGGSDGQ